MRLAGYNKSFIITICEMAPVKINSPVKGCWSFMNPPGHHPFAKDFVAVCQNGRPYKALNLFRHLFYTLHVRQTYAWEQDVYSPFAAQVVEIENNAPDRLRLNIVRDLINGLIVAPRKGAHDMRYFLGNYILLKSDDNIYALLAHLRQGSIVVEKGMQVNSGAQLAKVGNSGNTIQPHLHFQIMQERDPLRAVPIPFVFEHTRTGNSGAAKSVDSTLPGNCQTFFV